MSLSFDLEAVEGLLESSEVDAPWPAAAEGLEHYPSSLPTLPLEPDSRAEAVTIFGDRAHVTRMRAERLPAGASSLAFEGLPFGLVPGSLHATVPGEQPTSAGGGLVSSDMQAQVSSAGAVVFTIPERRTVQGDGSPQHIPLGTQTFSADTEFTTVPRQVPEVFRRVRLVYQGDAPL